MVIESVISRLGESGARAYWVLPSRSSDRPTWPVTQLGEPMMLASLAYVDESVKVVPLPSSIAQ